MDEERLAAIEARADALEEVIADRHVGHDVCDDVCDNACAVIDDNTALVAAVRAERARADTAEAEAEQWKATGQYHSDSLSVAVRDRREAIARADTAEAAIERVREMCERNDRPVRPAAILAALDSPAGTETDR